MQDYALVFKFVAACLIWTFIAAFFLIGRVFQKQSPQVSGYIVASWVAGFALAFAVVYGFRL